MRSKTWFFNFTILRKNISRFAPVWVIYSLLLLLPRLRYLGLSLEASEFKAMLTLDCVTMPGSHFVYAMVCAMTLFGDLFRSRMCYSLYALPIRREGWFLTNVVSGLLFSLIPNLVVTLILLPVCGSLWYAALLRFGIAALQFLFFFSIAVLAVYLTGKRFAMALLYFLINLLSILVYWLVDAVFGDYLYGIIIDGAPFIMLSPLTQMYDLQYFHTGTFQWNSTDGWGYLAVCTLVAVAFFGLALLCCRRRNLEAAGDFLAFRRFKAAMLIPYTLFIGMILSAFGIPVFLGFLVGYFSGLMLLERTGKVFRQKTIIGAAVFLGAYIICLMAIRIDLFGAIRWIPQVEDVQSVHLEYSGESITFDEPEKISQVLQIHKHGLSERFSSTADNMDHTYYDSRSVSVKLEYITQSGAVKKRAYHIQADSEAGKLLQNFMSTPEAVLGELYNSGATPVIIDLPKTQHSITDPAEIASLMDAILADCEQEHLNQQIWHTSGSTTGEYCTLQLVYYGAKDEFQVQSIQVYSNCENIVTWLKDHGIDPFDE